MVSRDSAYGGRAELTRYRVVDRDARRTELIEVDLAAIIRGDSWRGHRAAAVRQPQRSSETPDWGEQQSVVLKGEFRFPGRYSIKRGETLKSGDRRGPADSPSTPFPEGSVFTREDLREREQKQLDVLAKRVQNDLATLALQACRRRTRRRPAPAMAVGQSLLAAARERRGGGPARSSTCRRPCAAEGRRGRHHPARWRSTDGAEVPAGGDGHRRSADGHLALCTARS